MTAVGRVHAFGHKPESGRTKPSWHRRAATVSLSDLSLFRNLERVIDLDPKVSHGTFQLGVAKQELDGTQIAGLAIDLRRLGSTQRMGAVSARL